MISIQRESSQVFVCHDDEQRNADRFHVTDCFRYMISSQFCTFAEGALEVQLSARTFLPPPTELKVGYVFTHVSLSASRITQNVTDGFEQDSLE